MEHDVRTLPSGVDAMVFVIEQKDAEIALLKKRVSQAEFSCLELVKTSSELSMAIQTTCDQCDVMRARMVMDYGNNQAARLMGTMSKMFRAALEGEQDD